MRYSTRTQKELPAAVAGMSSTLTINANLSSLNAQRRLGDSTRVLQQSFERLSSGLRINKASDDAAGLAVATSLNTDARVYTTAIRNVNDALSLYSVAEGALGSLVDITTRLKELAQQSSNGVLEFTQRKSLDAEAQALGKEYRRITTTTQFNGQDLFNNLNGPLNIQAGYDALSLAGGTAPTGTFGAAQTFSTGSLPESVTAADVNGDGKTDLISADYSSHQLSVFLGNGDGSFQAASTIAAFFGPDFIISADLNGDGRADLIAANNFSNRIDVFLGNGDGTFLAITTFVTGSRPQSVTSSDLNGDGNLDLVSADLNSNVVSVFIGNGDGSFKAGTKYATGTNPRSVISTDVNGDGKPDLVSADSASNQLGVFIGNGDGTFQNAITYATGLTVFAVISADVNGDGRGDLISADSGSNQVSFFFGNGDGSFQAARTLATGSSPRSVISTDVNGDGNIDLISADSGSNQVSVLFGNGDGAFQAAQTYATGTSAVSVTSADVNRDGTIDLISADFAGHQLSVLLGNGVAVAVVASGVGVYSLLGRQSSRDALTQFSQVLNALTASLGTIGANESRLQTVNAVLQTTREVYTGAASQILDVDVAQEAAQLAKSNILQQAGAAILAQANQQPALALRLLQGLR